FFRNVDVSQVFRAGDIAQKREVTLIERAGMDLRAALNRLEDHNEDYAVVHDRGGKYLGAVTTDSLYAVLKAGDSNDKSGIEKAFVPAIKPVGSQMALTDIMEQVAECPGPVPVVDDDSGRYLGTISKSAL